MNTVFIHLRKWDDAGEVSCFGGATIAYTIHRMADSLHIKYAVAECCDTDRFIKRVGRDIALARLKSDVKENILGEMEIPVNLEEDIEKMIIFDYLEYKSEFLYEEDTDPDILINYFCPVHPSFDAFPEGA